jgi:hypothetical protein
MIQKVLAWFMRKPNIDVHSGGDIFRMPRTALIWILLSLVLVTIPHILRMPIWLTALCIFCISISRVYIFAIHSSCFVYVCLRSSYHLGTDVHNPD